MLIIIDTYIAVQDHSVNKIAYKGAYTNCSVLCRGPPTKLYQFHSACMHARKTRSKLHVLSQCVYGSISLHKNHLVINVENINRPVALRIYIMHVNDVVTD